MAAEVTLHYRRKPVFATLRESLLDRLGTYVDQYESDIAAVVSEEHYQQEVVSVNGMFGDKRLLRSDLLLSKAGDLGWVAFRDVFRISGGSRCWSSKSSNRQIGAAKATPYVGSANLLRSHYVEARCSDL